MKSFLFVRSGSHLLLNGVTLFSQIYTNGWLKTHPSPPFSPLVPRDAETRVFLVEQILYVFRISRVWRFCRCVFVTTGQICYVFVGHDSLTTSLHQLREPLGISFINTQESPSKFHIPNRWIVFRTLQGQTCTFRWSTRFYIYKRWC